VRIAVFITCFNGTMFPRTGRAVTELLELLGHRGVPAAERQDRLLPTTEALAMKAMGAVLGSKLVCVRSGKALDDNNSSSDSAVMVQKTDNGSYQQQWAVTVLGGGAYRLINRHSGKALDNSNNTADLTKIIQWTPNGGAPQQWNMTKVG
jgi:hypothetical protein